MMSICILLGALAVVIVLLIWAAVPRQLLNKKDEFDDQDDFD